MLPNRVRKAILFILCLAVFVEASAPWRAEFSSEGDLTSSYVSGPETFESYYAGAALRLTVLDEATCYVLEVCKQEEVDPLEMLAILQLENPKHKHDALNINYKLVYSKKLKREIKKEVSRDEGLFQLNSLCTDIFVAAFWTAYGETEEFNPRNYKHSTRVAVRLHKDNKKQFKGELYYAVLTYNAGAGRVARGNVPEHTLNVYWPRFIKYYSILKGE